MFKLINTPLFSLIACLSFTGFMSACSDSSDRRMTPPELTPEPKPEPISAPLVERAVNIGSIVLQATSFDLSVFNYKQSEFFLSGTAQAFTNTSELGEDGKWSIEPGETAEYKTRIVVYRPTDSADFNGTVIVEWFNVSSGFDTAPDWTMSHTELLRSGYAYVGVSALVAGVEGLPGSLLPLYPKAANPERYESLLLPGDSFSYDMFSQVAQALRSPGDIDPLDGLFPERLIAAGESQSAGRMLTYVNAIHPVYEPFDGYLIHSRTGGSSNLSQSPQASIPSPENVRVRDDLNVPVIMFQTESDLFILNSLPSRQEDSELFRLWEVAGTAHADLYTLDGSSDKGDNPAIAAVKERAILVPGLLECDSPVNNGPQHWVLKAAISALDNWVRSGTPAMTAPRLEISDDGLSFEFDHNGNVLGGIRTPYVDTPVAKLLGEGQSGQSFCLLFGTTVLFDDATLSTLYTDSATYIQAISTSTDQAVDAGFILPEDGALIKANAIENPVL